MSSTNHTANYGLSQFLGTDKPAWLVDYNGDMSAIDTQMKANADAASAAQTTANTADGKADTNASAISTLDTQVNGASGIASDVTTLQGSVNTITSLIGNGEPTTTDKTIIGAINELNSGKADSSEVRNAYRPKSYSVTADGVKSYSALLDDIQALLTADIESGHLYAYGGMYIGGINKTLVSESPFFNANPNGAHFMRTDFVDGTYAHIMTNGSSVITYDYSTSVRTDISSQVPASDVSITMLVFECLS